MKNSLEIKAISIAAHYDEISAMMRELHKHEHSLFDKTAAWKDIETGYMRHVIHMQENSDGRCLVAYINDTAIGFIFGYIEEQDDSRIEVYEGKELYVSDGYMAEAYRRQGIYRQLNKELEAWYIKKGVKRITRYTQIKNTCMQQLLGKEGYITTRVLYEKWL